MNQTSSEKLFSIATIILAVWLVIKLFWVIIEYAFLPTQGVNMNESSVKGKLYYRYKFATDKQQVVQPKKLTPVEPKVKLPSLDDYKLVGVYIDDQDAIVTLTKSSKSFVLTRGDKVDGYTLVDADKESAIFKKDKKKYSIKIEKKSKNRSSSKGTNSSTKPASVGTNKRANPEQKATPPNPNPATSTPGDATSSPVSSSSGSSSQNSGPLGISREAINSYMEDPTKLRSDIGLRAVARDGVIIGYKVRFVRSSSPLGKAGLQRGDIIKSVNGEDVSNPSAAMGALKNIKNADSATIKIIRANQEKELEYEIK